MKIAASILFLLIPVVVVAQNYKGMNEGDMQKMMEQMQMMEACMRNIDQAELKELERRTNQIEDEVKSLCASGNRDEAQEKAISFGKEVSKSPVIQAMRKCGDRTKGMMPGMAFTEEDEDSDRHVCDE